MCQEAFELYGVIQDEEFNLQLYDHGTIDSPGWQGDKPP